MTFSEDLGRNLKDARIAVGMTQSEVAQMLRVTQNSISQYENARRMPNLKLASALAWVYDTTMDDLVPQVRVDEQEYDDNQMRGEWC